MIGNMNLLYIGTWSVSDPLSRSTILPHLEVLQRKFNFTKIVYCSLERSLSTNSILQQDPGMFHLPYFTKNQFGMVENMTTYIKYFGHLRKAIDKHRIDAIICRGVIAGCLGYKLWKKTKIDFFVESFEPHAQYMLEAGSWSVWNPKFIIQKYFENKQKKHALGLMPVSENYKKKLLSEGIEKKRIQVLPCTVDTGVFKPCQNSMQIRERFGFSKDQIIGIYVGKFGDIYLDKESFYIFKKSFQYFGADFRLIILSPQDGQSIKERVHAHKLDPSKVKISFVDTVGLRNFLTIADFAYCTVRPGKSRLFCCPVKNGEYWAMGLPVVITQGIGDDSELIDKLNAGVVLHNFEETHLINCFDKLKNILKEPNHKIRIRELAKKYRSREYIQRVYSHFFAFQHLTLQPTCTNK